MKDFIGKKIKEIQAVVHDDNVLLGISGGVDSSVAAVLIAQAIKNQLTCMFIDHGLLRKNEAQEVMDMFDKFGIKVVKIDAQERFLSRLKGIVNPEEKRIIIGETFIDCFNEESKKLGNFKFLAQGTLFTDIIESGTKDNVVVKSHHNVGGLPENMKFELLEPLKNLYKNQVRALGLALNMPAELINRQPFPGPGLAIRIIGEVTKEKLQILKDSDYILREEFKNHGLDKTVWQYFTVLTGLKTVGIKNKKRNYSYTIAIRAVDSIDGLNATWAKIPYEILEKVSCRMTTEVERINRVVLDITSKPPATIEWE